MSWIYVAVFYVLEITKVNTIMICNTDIHISLVKQLLDNYILLHGMPSYYKINVYHI